MAWLLLSTTPFPPPPPLVIGTDASLSVTRTTPLSRLASFHPILRGSSRVLIGNGDLSRLRERQDNIKNLDGICSAVDEAASSLTD